MDTRIVAAAWAASLIFTDPAAAVNPYRGGLMYENYCYYCHYRNVHFRPRTKVHSLDDLAHQVRIWQEVAGMNWSDADVADVQAYLNWLYYRFPYSATMPAP